MGQSSTPKRKNHIGEHYTTSEGNEFPRSAEESSAVLQCHVG